MPVTAHTREGDASARTGSTLFLIGLSLVLAFASLSVRHATYFGDEGFHRDQIQIFLRGERRISPSLTMFPGYHALLALVSLPFGTVSIEFFRTVMLLLSILSVWVFHTCARLLDPRTALARTAQYVFLPILFPFFFILYTDAASLLFMLLGVYGLLRRRYWLAALMGVFAMLMRQNNVIWFAFLAATSLVDEAGPIIFAAVRKKLPARLRRVSLPRMPKALPVLSVLTGVAAFTAGFALFAAFFAWNGGLVIGDRSAHPFPSVHLGNIFFLLALFGLFFLPLLVALSGRVLERMRTSPLLVPLLTGLFIACLLLFVNDHPYNQDLHSVFLRNRVLVFLSLSPPHTVLLAVPVLAALAILGVTRLKRPSFLLLYPFTILFLLPSWLIEQRYYFIPLVLFLLFREPVPERAEWGAALYGAVGAFFLHAIVVSRTLFL